MSDRFAEQLNLQIIDHLREMAERDDCKALDGHDKYMLMVAAARIEYLGGVDSNEKEDQSGFTTIVY